MNPTDRMTKVLGVLKAYDQGRGDVFAVRCALVMAGCRINVTELDGPDIIGQGLLWLIKACKGTRADVMEFAIELGQRPTYEVLMDELLAEAFSGR